MIDHTKPPCEECGSFDHDNHHPRCSKKSDKEKIRGFIEYYEAWLKIREETDRIIERFRKKITFWEGKYKIVKQENNALRKKLYGKGERR